MSLIIDEHKIAYFLSLPEGARPARLDDFHRKGRRRVGMPFLCLSRSTGHYVVYRMTGSTRAGRLKFFIDLGDLFVFDAVPQTVSDYLNL